MVDEVWMNIHGYESLYQISNLGRVKSITKCSIHMSGDYIKKDSIDKDGYAYVKLRKERKYKQWRVHRLVAMHFIGLPENYKNLQVNHLDGNKSNNRVDNLEWCTLAENIQHGYRMGLYRVGEEKHNAKLTNNQIKEIRSTYIRGSRTKGIKPLARKYGVSAQAIRYIINKVTYKDVI